MRIGEPFRLTVSSFSKTHNTKATPWPHHLRALVAIDHRSSDGSDRSATYTQVVRLGRRAADRTGWV